MSRLPRSLCQRPKGITGLVGFVRPLLLFLVLPGLFLPAVTAMGQSTGFFRDPPILEPLIAAGALPEAADRLPTVPLIVQPIGRTGRHGGVWRMAMKGDSDRAMIYRTIGYEHLVRWDIGFTRVIPNIARSISVSDDATVFTFRLRSGMRWSDGHPFTADDILFWYDAVLKNQELTPYPPAPFVTAGNLVRVERVDDLKVRFLFADPHGLFLKLLASGRDSGGPVDFPRHWLSRFHPDHNPDGIAAEIAAAGARDWVDLFRLKSGDERIPKKLPHLLRIGINAAVPDGAIVSWPTLNAWSLRRVAAAEAGQPRRLIAARNPYYFKIDPAGHQLPYLDRVEFLLYETRPQIRALAVAGGIGMQARRLTDPDSQKLLTAPGQAALFDRFTLAPTQSNDLPFTLNLSHPDPRLRAVFGMLDFRIALSHAIDRAAIVRSVYGGDRVLSQGGPRPESRFYNERMATQYLAFDLDKAGQHLAAAGFSRAGGGDGPLLAPDGEPVAFTISVRNDQPHHLAAMDLIVDNWRALGLDTTIMPMNRARLEDQVRANRHDAAFAFPDGGLQPELSPWVYLPWNHNSIFGNGWALWFDDPGNSAAVMPPRWARRQHALYRTLLTVPEADARDQLMREILAIGAENFPTFGISLKADKVGVRAPAFRNVPRAMIDSWAYPTPAPTNPSQYYLE